MYVGIVAINSRSLEFRRLGGRGYCLANPLSVGASTNPAVTRALGYLPNQQQFQALDFPQSILLNQNYLNPSTFLPLGFQPFGYPQGKNFVYAYAQQATLASSAIWAADLPLTSTSRTTL